jgi:hypothetical protein
MDNLGADANGVAITNKRRNKGQFIADFRYYVRPLHTEFAEAIFHKREQFCIPQVSPCNPDPGYPVQSYNSSLPICPLPTGWPANTGPIAIPQTTGTIQGVSVPIATGNTEPVDTAQPIAGETSTNPPDR